MLSLKIGRIEKGLTQKMLANDLGMSPSTICKIETGSLKIADLKVSTLNKIAKKLDISISDLIESI